MEQKDYKVSVVVSVYKAQPYIERCARSLFEQTYPNLEYVFVDDCTPDNSIGVLQRVMKEYPEREGSVKIIRHAVNKGLAAVRNTGFDNASGEFICVVDSDDWMELDGIERMVEEQVATNADVVWGKALFHYEDGEVIFSEPKYKDLEEWRMYYFAVPGYHIVNWRRIIRRSLLEQHHIRHEEGFHIGNDRQIMPIIAYYAKSFSSVDAIVYHYEKRNPLAHTYKNSHGGYVLSAYTKDIESALRIIRFLKDKECKYLEAAEFGKLQSLLGYREIALRNRSREGFQIMMKWIMETPAKYREHFGWGDSIGTRLRACYALSFLWVLAKRAYRSFCRLKSGLFCRARGQCT